MSDTKFFAKLDVDGNVLGFYPSDIFPIPPANAIEITREQWQLFINKQGSGNICRFINGNLVEVPRDED